MAESVAEATLKPVEKNHELLSLASALVHEHYPDLEKAVIVSFWTLNRPLSNWGACRPTTEFEWWQSGSDIGLRVNLELWNSLSLPGRRGLLDHLLSCVDAKHGGTTTMQTARGVRQLFESKAPSLSVHPAVIARNPAFVGEIAELASLHKALTDPAQFLLELGQAKPAEDTEKTEKPRRAAKG